MPWDDELSRPRIVDLVPALSLLRHETIVDGKVWYLTPAEMHRLDWNTWRLSGIRYPGRRIVEFVIEVMHREVLPIERLCVQLDGCAIYDIPWTNKRGWIEPDPWGWAEEQEMLAARGGGDADHR